MKLSRSTKTCLVNRLAIAAGVLFAIGGCGSNSASVTSPPTPAHTQDAGSGAAPPPVSTETPAATQPQQKLFATPDDAAAALKDAVAQNDRHTLVGIFGPEGKQLIFSGDRVQEANDMKAFATVMSEYLRVDPQSSEKAILYIGHENWPFPIPVVKGEGGWFFDTAAGKDELLNRRIGENELGAIEVCRAYVVAQKEYAGKDRTGDKVNQYAQHFMSGEGKKDGLYWPAAANEEISPMGPLVAEARAEGYLTEPKTGKRRPFHGYFFHILTAQGDTIPGGKMSYLVDGHLVKGFAMISWPDKWGSSGIMTFVVNQEGKVYEKNLGDQTSELVKAMTEYNPDSTWQEVKD